ncbi:MAG: peptide deformylase [Verrucomicrobiales bacterium]|jgi:peptide deformylase|nr:peptide deformylase [Verrucomicrobiales bacterium]
MILPIVKYGDPVLRRKGALVTKVTPELRQLARDMLDTMRKAEGVGLAAQQVGRALQMAVIDIPADSKRKSRLWVDGREADVSSLMPLTLINPQIETTKKKELDNEGCLSFPGINIDLNRGFRVKVRYQDWELQPREFEAGGLLGRAVQHEFDHLNGVLFIDKMSAADREKLQDKLRKLKAES